MYKYSKYAYCKRIVVKCSNRFSKIIRRTKNTYKQSETKQKMTSLIILIYRMTAHMTYDRIPTRNTITRSVVRSVTLQKFLGLSNLTLCDELDEANG